MHAVAAYLDEFWTLGCILLPQAPLSSPKRGREGKERGEGKATLQRPANAMHAASTQGQDRAKPLLPSLNVYQLLHLMDKLQRFNDSVDESLRPLFAVCRLPFAICHVATSFTRVSRQALLVGCPQVTPCLAFLSTRGSRERKGACGRLVEGEGEGLHTQCLR